MPALYRLLSVDYGEQDKADVHFTGALNRGDQGGSPPAAVPVVAVAFLVTARTAPVAGVIVQDLPAGPAALACLAFLPAIFDPVEDSVTAPLFLPALYLLLRPLSLVGPLPHLPVSLNPLLFLPAAFDPLLSLAIAVSLFKRLPWALNPLLFLSVAFNPLLSLAVAVSLFKRLP